MIILTETTDTIKVSLEASQLATACDCIASYRDITTSDYTPQRSLTQTNGTTPVTLVSSPAASTQRVIDFIRVHNRDSKTSHIIITLNDNGTDYILFHEDVETKGSVEYVDGQGFKIINASGEIALSVNQSESAAGSILKTVLGSDVSTTSATIGDVTGLSFAVTAHKRYWFKFVIQYDASATATGGSLWTINGPTTSELRYRSDWSLTTTTNTFGNYATYNQPAGVNATAALTGGNIATIEGHITPTANGTVIARFASEGATITAKTGSLVFYQEL